MHAKGDQKPSRRKDGSKGASGQEGSAELKRDAAAGDTRVVPVEAGALERGRGAAAGASAQGWDVAGARPSNS